MISDQSGFGIGGGVALSVENLCWRIKGEYGMLRGLGQGQIGFAMAVMDLRSRAAQRATIVYYAGSGHREASWRDNEINSIVQPCCATLGCATWLHNQIARCAIGLHNH